MPRPRVHDPDRLLDTAERLVVNGGPEQLTVRRLGAEAGVSNGAIYHAFGSLAALQGRMWLRAATDFLALQTELIDQALAEAPAEADAAVDAVVATADAPARFAHQRPAAAKMLITVRREQLLGPELPAEVADALLDLDRQLISSVLCRLAISLWGRRDGPAVEVVTTCVVDLPTALFRRALAELAPDGAARISSDLRERLETAVRAVLDLPPPRQAARSRERSR